MGAWVHPFGGFQLPYRIVPYYYFFTFSIKKGIRGAPVHPLVREAERPPVH